MLEATGDRQALAEEMGLPRDPACLSQPGHDGTQVRMTSSHTHTEGLWLEPHAHGSTVSWAHRSLGDVCTAPSTEKEAHSSHPGQAVQNVPLPNSPRPTTSSVIRGKSPESASGPESMSLPEAPS